jgi:hypothetical protein
MAFHIRLLGLFVSQASPFVVQAQDRPADYAEKRSNPGGSPLTPPCSSKRRPRTTVILLMPIAIIDSDTTPQVRRPEFERP